MNYQHAHARRKHSFAPVIILLVALAIVLSSILITRAVIDSQPLPPDSVSGNSAYLATSGTCIPALLDSGASTCIGGTRIYNIRSFTVNPGKCYVMDGGQRFSSRGSLPAFYYLPAGSHWFRAC